MLGILSIPDLPSAVGVVIVVGGPQYRVGSHRQFLLLSRQLAQAGHSVLRFDYRGMGDSTGDARDFLGVSDDIGAAIEALFAAVPQVRKVVLWGLCDAASASLLYLADRNDPRVAGLCLLNPWVRSEASLAKTHIKHYYGNRLLQPAFWMKLFSGKLDVLGALGGFLKNLWRATPQGGHSADNATFQARMARVLRGFQGRVLLLLSGDDYTAKEFLQHAESDPVWEGALERSELATVAGADHTFSCQQWRGEVEARTLAWLQSVVNEFDQGEALAASGRERR